MEPNEYRGVSISYGVFPAEAIHKNGLSTSVFITLSDKGKTLLSRQLESTTLLLSNKHVSNVQNKNGEDVSQQMLASILNYEIVIEVNFAGKEEQVASTDDVQTPN